MVYQYKLVACGGTFGPLHKGHESFLLFAFSYGEKVLIGITSDAYVKENKKDTNIPSYSDRKTTVEAFLEKNNLLRRAIIVPINSVFGPIIDNSYQVEALIATENTKNGAVIINEKREKNGLLPLQIIVSPLMKGVASLPLSSTHIRSGFMDLYGNTTWFTKNLSLPIPVRKDLQKPFGELLTDGMNGIANLPAEKIITVGDVTTKRFIEHGIFPKLSVIDFVVERKQTHKTIQNFGFTGSEEVFSVKNPAGSITIDAWKVLLVIVEKIFTKKTFVLLIKGEEDLLVLPLLLVLPKGFFVFYGQPKEGLVCIEVTKEAKNRAAELVNRFVNA